MNTIKTTVEPDSHTMASFRNCIEALCQIYIPDTAAVNNQKMYLQRVKKNDKYTVPQFLDRIKHINMLLSPFPGATAQDCFTPEEIKRFITPCQSDGA